MGYIIRGLFKEYSWYGFPLIIITEHMYWYKSFYVLMSLCMYVYIYHPFYYFLYLWGYMYYLSLFLKTSVKFYERLLIIFYYSVFPVPPLCWGSLFYWQWIMFFLIHSVFSVSISYESMSKALRGQSIKLCHTGGYWDGYICYRNWDRQVKEK